VRVPNACVQATDATSRIVGFLALCRVVAFLRLLRKLHLGKNSLVVSLNHMVGSLSCTSRHPYLDPPRRDFGVLLAAHEVDLGGPDIGVPGEFRCPVGVGVAAAIGLNLRAVHGRSLRGRPYHTPPDGSAAVATVLIQGSERASGIQANQPPPGAVGGRARMEVAPQAESPLGPPR
jgi:hypothetical protein